MRDSAIGKRFLRKARRNFLDLLFDSLDCGEGIITVTNDDNSSDSFSSTFVQSSAPKSWPQRDTSDVTNRNWNVVFDLNDNLLEIFDILNKAQTTNYILGLVDFDRSCTDVHVRHANGGVDFA